MSMRTLPVNGRSSAPAGTGERRASWATSGTATLIALSLVACEPSVTTDLTAPSEPSSSMMPGMLAVATDAAALTRTNTQIAAIHDLQSAFHAAIHDSDRGAMHALWTEDATVNALGASVSGPNAIADFFEATAPFQNGWAALAPTYKTKVTIHGNRAEFAFECVYVPDTGLLAGQSVTAHLNATGIMRKVGNRWLFERFVGAPGPLP